MTIYLRHCSVIYAESFSDSRIQTTNMLVRIFVRLPVLVVSPCIEKGFPRRVLPKLRQHLFTFCPEERLGGIRCVHALEFPHEARTSLRDRNILIFEPYLTTVLEYCLRKIRWINSLHSPFHYKIFIRFDF